MTVRLTTLLTITAIFFSLVQTLAQNRLYKKALKAYERGSYTNAIDHLNEIENLDPASRVLLANALYATEQYEEARAMWKTLLDDQDRAVIYNNIGGTFYNLADADSSIIYMKRALELDPYSDLYMLNLGLGYADMEENGKACAHYFLSAQRKNKDALSMYESENCISWQHQWLPLVPGDHMTQVSNTSFLELHQAVISVDETFVMMEHGIKNTVTLKEMIRTNVGIVFTFEDQRQKLLHRWASFTEDPVFDLTARIEPSAAR